jgi:2-furoate---CoA ligase
MDIGRMLTWTADRYPSILVAGAWVPQARFDAGESLELITTEKISALYLVPTI